MRIKLLVPAFVLVAAFGAAVTAQPVTPPGLKVVTHDSTMTGSGTVASVLSLADGAVSLAKMANLATARIICRVTAGTGVPESCSGAQVVSILPAATTTANGVVPNPGTATGKVLSDSLAWIDEVGDIAGIVTNGILTGGCTSGTCTLDTSVTGPTVLGRTSGTGAVQQLTPTQATALFDVATTSVKGLVPTLPNDASKFFDGTGAYSLPVGLLSGLTANAILKAGSATTAVNSLLTDDGTTLKWATNKLTVDTSGNTAIAGTLGVTGIETFTATLNGNTSGSARIRGDAASTAIVPTLVPNGTASTTGVGGTAGNISLINGGVETVRVATGSASVTAVAITSTQAAGGNLGSEILDASSWTSTGWTGTGPTFTHSTGNTTALSRTMTNTIGQLYQVAYTVTGRTAGSFTVSLGGSGATGAITATGATGPQVLSTNGALVITPTTDFDGTIALSVKLISNVASLVTINNAAGGIIEMHGDRTGADDIFIGVTSGRNLTTGTANTGVGGGTLRTLTTGTGNTALGYLALQGVSTGTANTALGDRALNSTTTGASNIGIGQVSLVANTTGNNNIAIGQAAITSNLTGSSNVAIGASALSLATGSNNTAIGANALQSIGAVSENAAVGNSAGRLIADGSTTNTTPTQSVYIGNSTKALADGQSNQIVIGYNAIGAGSNSVTLGNTSVAKTILQGYVSTDSSTVYGWTSSSTDPTATNDTGIARNAAGVVEINNGTAGTLRDLAARKYLVGSSTGPSWSSGTGSPESVVTAPVGSFFSRTDGGAGTSWYVKESGAGNTGWVAK